MTSDSDTGGAAGPLHRALVDQRDGQVSAAELAESALEAMERHSHLGSMVAIDADGARRDAEAADRDRRAGHWRGPLHGIPITVKDVIHVAGLPTRAGSDAFLELAKEDAASVALLRRAGAVIVGKASTHEFALGVTTPQSRNPHDPTRIPGGSSGGSAINVATGMAMASLGTDTRASIRCPAALSGVVGLKPTYGSIPTGGIVSLSWTMDHIAPMARTVADVALVLDVLLGAGTRMAATGPARGLRVGVPEAAFEDAEAPVAMAVRGALDELAGAGFEVVPVARPSGFDLDLAGAAGLMISRAEAATAHRSLGLDRSRYWEEVDDQLRLGEQVPAVDYLDAQRRRGQLAEDLLEPFYEVDILAMPTVLVLAPRAQDFARYLSVLARTAIPWSLVGFPAISVPCHADQELPVGLQFVAPPGGERLLVAAGRAYEQVARQNAGSRRA